MSPTAHPEASLVVRQLGTLPYQPVFQAMQAFTAARDAKTPDEIWLLQHPPVFTLGLNGKAEHLLDPGDIPVAAIDRGGQVTYHGPGQLVAYLLIDLRRRHLGVRQLVSLMEQAVIDQLAQFGIHAMARADAPGVYVGGAKVAALGLRIKQGRSYHGLSLNLAMDLTPFSRINPCGHAGMAVTDLHTLGVDAEEGQIRHTLTKYLSRSLGFKAFRETSDSGPFLVAASEPAP